MLGKEMLRQIIVIFVCLLGFDQAVTNATDLPVVNEAAVGRQTQAAPRRGALFKIHDADHALFLFGTIHAGKPDFYPLEATVMQALAQSSRIALEVDPSNAEPSQQALQEYGFFPDGQTLQLAPKLQSRLVEILKKQGVQYAAVAQMKPWMLVVLLAMNEYAAQGYQASLAIDLHLSDFARAQKKSVVELESAAGQMSLFGKLSIADQIRLLEGTLAEIEDKTSEQKVLRLTSMWRDADAAGLDAFSREMAEDKTFSGKFLQRVLLDGRNPALASGLEKLLKSETTSFAGIGILHLIGEGGVPALLRRRGYKVERVY